MALSTRRPAASNCCTKARLSSFQATTKPPVLNAETEGSYSLPTVSVLTRNSLPLTVPSAL